MKRRVMENIDGKEVIKYIDIPDNAERVDIFKDYCVVARTLVCNDGVVGLNGWQYLLNDKEEEMEFESVKQAKEYLINAGETEEWIDEWVEYKLIRSKREKS